MLVVLNMTLGLDVYRRKIYNSFWCY